jgi:hypothetical protein
MLALLISQPLAASANDLRITPYLGYRVGGEFKDFTTGTRLKLDEGDSYGLIVGWGEEDIYEVLYSQQPSKLNASGPVSSGSLFDVNVTNIMFHSKNVLDRESGGFVSGMVGITHFDPDFGGLSTDTRFALGAGGGFDYPINNRLSLRLEGRAIATFMDSNSGIFCSSSSGCAIYTNSSVLWQFEAVTGFTFKF